jgi:hypothetical protein
MADKVSSLPQVVVNTQSYFSSIMPIWGITLPKGAFLGLFEEEKGKWPAGKRYTDAVRSRFGGYLPNDKYEMVLPPDAFLEQDRLFGVRCFGGIYAPSLERTLSLEVMDKNSHVGFYPVKDIGLIRVVRMHTLEEVGCTPHHLTNVDFDMNLVRRYFSGEFKGKSLEVDLKDRTSNCMKDWIRLLRHCNFAEDNIFKE